MSVFLFAAVIVSSLFMTFYLHAKNIRLKELTDPVMKISPLLFFGEALLAACDLAGGGDMVASLVFDLSLALLPLIVMTSSVWERRIAIAMAKAGFAVQMVVVLIRLLCALDLLAPFPPLMSLKMTMLVILITGMIYFASIWIRIRDVRAVMKAGTVWMCLALAIDSIYVMALMSNMIAYVFLATCFPRDGWPSYILVIMMGAEVSALGFRVAADAVFVFWHRQERRIVESMKISHVEVSNDSSRDGGQYKDIYERVVTYFEEEKPYLNGELTINDIVKVVFTNKLYISKAISQYTGRNFCQFVNYYRVTHSVKLFRKNPDLKIVELANACGFNSVVSFNMAFRLFMSESPSDWCRKERVLLMKGKNKLWNR